MHPLFEWSSWRLTKPDSFWRALSCALWQSGYRFVVLLRVGTTASSADVFLVFAVLLLVQIIPTRVSSVCKVMLTLRGSWITRIV